MTASAVVIGAGVSGLVAATYLARAGASVVLLEADAVVGGGCANRIAVGDAVVPAGPQALFALDAQMTKELALPQAGLRYAVRDLPLIALRAGGGFAALGRDLHQARRSIAPFSPRDAERFREFRHQLYGFARGMRAVWWKEGALRGAGARTELQRLRVASAAGLLETAFESEILQSAFAFDAMAGGLSPADAGSTLLLAWRAAQEMCGLQGAAALISGGPAQLVEALLVRARQAGVDIRTGAVVEKLLVEGEAVRGVVLAGGETVPAGVVLSSLSRRQTLLDFLPSGVIGFATSQILRRPQETGEAKVVLALDSVPSIFRQPGRFVLSERLDAVIAAHSQARAGEIPADLVLEVVVLEAGTGRPVLLSVMARPVPVDAASSTFVAALARQVVRRLERYIPNLPSHITALGVVPPQCGDCLTPAHVVASWSERIATSLRGLFLCGEAAEPVPAVSGRAARLAADMARQHLEEGVA